MANLTDELSEQEWNDARSWAERLKENPEDEELLTEFEAWLGDVPVRAGAYRKILDTLKLLPLLRTQSDTIPAENCPNGEHPPIEK